MKFTQYFQAMRQRPDRAIIEIEWIQRVIEHPLKEIVQQDGRIRRWACIEEANGKYLRVICFPMGRLFTTHFLTGRLRYEN